MTIINSLPPTTFDPIVSNAGFLYGYGMNLVFNTGTTLLITDGAFRDSTNNDDIGVNTNGVGTILNFSINGFNGLDTGTLANTQFYQIFAIADPTGFNPPGFIASINSVPILPTNYGLYRRIGWIRTTAGPLLFNFTQIGSQTDKIYQWNNVIMGTASTPSGTFTTLDLNYAVPPQICQINIQLIINVAGASTLVSIRPTGTTATGGNCPVEVSGIPTTTTIDYGNIEMICGLGTFTGVQHAAVDYLVSGSSTTQINIAGFTDAL